MPNQFNFTPLVDQDVNANVVSNEITVSGIDAPTPISIVGPATLIVDGQTSAAETVENGQRVALRLTTSGAFDTTVSATLIIGGVEATFSATTKVQPPIITVTNLNNAGPGSLRQAVVDASHGTRIEFSPSLSGQLTLLSQILVDKSIEIAGPGASVITIFGDRQNRLFVFDRPITGQPITATVSNLTLAEGTIAGTVDVSGGAIRVEQDVTLRLRGVVVRDSDASQSGGAISNAGVLTIVESEISGNTANGSSGAGGAIYSSGELRISNSVISGNRSVNNIAGGIYASGTLVVEASSISGNSSGGAGGGVYVDSDTTADFADAFVHSNNAAGDGGGLYATTATVTIRNGSRFNNNMTLGSAYGDGGGAYIYRGTLQIENTTFANNQSNTASAYQGGEGGALLLDQVLAPRLIRVVLSSNSAQRAGGAISVTSWLNPDLSIENSELVGNSAPSGGALFRSGYSDASYLVQSSTFTSNTATTAGGAIYWHNGGQGQIRNSTFTGNLVSAGAGGAIWTNRQIMIIESTIVGNTASALGDGIHATQLTLRNSVVALNGDSDISGLSSVVTSQGYNLVGNGTDTGLVSGRTGDIVGSAAAPIDPLIAELADNGGPTRTMAPLAGSPVIGHVPAGSNFSVTDQRGRPRPGPDGVSDIGAYESN